MRKVTMNEYIELIDELCAKCNSGELTEEGVNDILAEITIGEWKSDPCMHQMIIYCQITILYINLVI